MVDKYMTWQTNCHPHLHMCTQIAFVIIINVASI